MGTKQANTFNPQDTNMALYSLFKITALCALFQAATAAVPPPSCTGDRTEGNPKSSPYGTYSQMDVKLDHGVTIDYIGVTYGQPGTQPFYGPQKYMLDLDGCVITSTNPFHCMPIGKPGGLHLNIDNGMFIPTMDKNAGQMFAPGGDPNLLGHGVGIGSILKIHWCPTEDYFLVNLNGQMLDPLKKAQTSVFATVSPHADVSGPAQFPEKKCTFGLLGACNSGTRHSTLTCVRHCYSFDVGLPTCRPKNPVEGEHCCPDQTCAGGLECRVTEGGDDYATCKQPKLRIDPQLVCAPRFVEDCTRTGGKVGFEVFGAKVTCHCDRA